jgi:hypothetical protein
MSEQRQSHADAQDHVLTAAHRRALTRVSPREQSRSAQIPGGRCDQTISSEAAGLMVCDPSRTRTVTMPRTPEPFVLAARYVWGGRTVPSLRWSLPCPLLAPSGRAT